MTVKGLKIYLLEGGFRVSFYARSMREDNGLSNISFLHDFQLLQAAHITNRKPNEAESSALESGGCTLILHQISQGLLKHVFIAGYVDKSLWSERLKREVDSKFEPSPELC